MLECLILARSIREHKGCDDSIIKIGLAELLEICGKIESQVFRMSVSSTYDRRDNHDVYLLDDVSGGDSLMYPSSINH